MNKKTDFLKDEAGLSLVEILIAIAILGGAGWVMMNSSTLFNQAKNASETGNQLAESQGVYLESAKRVLFDTLDDNNERREGVCKIVVPDKVAEPPVGPINVRLSKLDKVLTDERWEDFLYEWKVKGSGKECAKDKYSYCFELDKSQESISKNLLKLNPVLNIQVVPVNLNPKEGGIFEVIPPGKFGIDIDGKSVGFSFIATLYTDGNNKGQRKKTVSESFEWVGLAGYCHYTRGKEELILSFSGMESIKGKNVIFNRNGFDSNKLAPVDITFRSIIAQAGIYKPDGQYIFTDKSKNIVTSCKENKFRCRQRSSGKRTYDDLSVVADLKYRRSNYVGSSASMKTKITYSIKKGGQQSFSNKNYYYGVGVDCSRLSPEGKPNPSCVLKEAETSLTGSHLVSVTSFDGDDFKTDKTCRKICDKGSGYNIQSGGAERRYAGYLNFEFLGYGKNQEELVSDKIGCTACYMKNCDQFGLGTFGPMAGMPSQPLDSNIPECSIYEGDSVVYDMLAFTRHRFHSDKWEATADKCVVGKIDSSFNKLALETEECTEKLPVMCYNFGKFFLARDVQNGSSVLSGTTFENAAERCFKTSKEIVATGKLDSFLGESADLPVSKGSYNFYNLASQGQFIAPQSQADMQSYNQWRLKNGVATSTKFWVALAKDGEKGVISRLPMIPNFIDKQKDAIYFDGQKKLLKKRFSFGMKHAEGEATYSGILFHNIKMKGVILGKQISKGRRKMPFLCREEYFPFKLFISSKEEDNVAEGEAVCKKEGAHFLPPITTYEWVKAMTLVEEVSELHAFPDPSEISGIKDVNAVWVGIRATDNKEHGIRYDNYPISNLKNKFGSILKYKPADTDPEVVLNGDGEYLAPYAFALSGPLLGSKVDMPPNSELQIKLNGSTFTSKFNTGGTGNKEIEFSEIVTGINDEIGVEGRAKIKDMVGIKFLEVKSRKIGDSGEIQFKATALSGSLGFSSKKERGPKLHNLCIASSGKLSETKFKDVCIGSPISADKLLSIKVFKNIWTLYDFPKTKNFYFKR